VVINCDVTKNICKYNVLCYTANNVFTIILKLATVHNISSTCVTATLTAE